MIDEDKLPDTCSKPKYSNDSRKCLLNYESNFLPDAQPASVMKEHFRPPSIYSFERKDTAKRREMVRNKIIAETMDEIEREKAVPLNIEEYCTTYDEKFQIPGFTVNDKTPEDTELHLKYPLYSSIPITIWSEKIQNTTRDFTRLEGMTKIRDPQNPFKKNDSFTTPVSQRLDAPET